MIGNALNTLVNSGQVEQPNVGQSVLAGVDLAKKHQQADIGNALSQQKLDLTQQQFDAGQDQAAQQQQRLQAQQQWISENVDQIVPFGGDELTDQVGGLIRMRAESGDIDGAMGMLEEVLKQDKLNVVKTVTADDGTITSIVQTGNKLKAVQLGQHGPKKQNNLNIQTVTDAAGNVRQIVTDPQTGQVVNQNALGAIGKPQSGMSVSFDANGNPVVVQGPNAGASQLGRSATGKTQNDIVRLEQNLEDLDSIANDHADSFLTFGGKAKNAVNAFLDKTGVVDLDDEDSAQLQQHTRFVQNVEQVFNQYRKEITGAAAAIQELDRLKKSLINTDLSPTQFRAAYSLLQEKMRRGLAIKKQLLSEGVDLATPQGGQRFEQEYFQKSATTLPSPEQAPAAISPENSLAPPPKAAHAFSGRSQRNSKQNQFTSSSGITFTVE